MHEYDYNWWKPMKPKSALDLLGGLGCTWWIAGGCAIDLYLGRKTRAHEDLDVSLFHKDQEVIRDYLTQRAWELHCADPPGTLRAWRNDEYLPGNIHDIWCRRGPDQPWEFQLMLNPGDGERFVSRRDPSFAWALNDAILTRQGTRILAPEIQLHFKAKRRRKKDTADLLNTLPELSQSARNWLREALRRTYGDHPWLKHFANAE